ncbi:MAG: ABC1 kinase family protein [Acidimicrobiales bacterium]
MSVLLAALLIVVTGVPFVALLVVVPRRLLGLQIGLVRAVIAAGVANAAWFGAGRAFSSSRDDQSVALVTVQVGLTLLGAMAFLAVAEAVVPSGSGLRIMNWRRASRRKLGRSRRYGEIVAIMVRHGLVSARRRRRASNDVVERRALAHSLRLALEEGGVTFIKLGQLLSARRDLLPPEFTDELGTLTDGVPPVAWEEIERTLHEEFGSAAVFANVDPQPLAAASIAQVHAATLSSGEAVVVKVQRPGIGPLIERDVDILSRLARSLEARSRWARSVGAVELANGFASAIGEELDFRVEARNMAAVVSGGARRDDASATVAVKVPVPTARLCTRRVLVMERLNGTSIGAAVSFDERTVDRSHLARALLHVVLTQIMLDGVFHADPHPGNVLLLDDGRIGLLDFGSVGRLDPTVRSSLRQLFVAFDRQDPAAARDALVEILVPAADLDQQRLERASCAGGVAASPAGRARPPKCGTYAPGGRDRDREPCHRPGPTTRAWLVA